MLPATPTHALTSCTGGWGKRMPPGVDTHQANTDIYFIVAGPAR